jgi:hypothetical protein
LRRGYSDNFGLGDGKVDFDNCDGIRRRVAYLIETVKNFAAPPQSSRVIRKGGEAGATLTIANFDHVHQRLL